MVKRPLRDGCQREVLARNKRRIPAVFIYRGLLWRPSKNESLVGIMEKAFPSVKIYAIHARDTGEVWKFEQFCLFKARTDAPAFLREKVAQGGKAFKELSGTDANSLADTSRDVYGKGLEVLEVIELDGFDGEDLVALSFEVGGSDAVA